ncbi:DUF3108 domain-containing protein [Dongia sp.]|uniref:DUF3108 domain-containing protein n=1 Tax=Dongia sp. TaxID=1977262 RepID=UPI0035B03429
MRYLSKPVLAGLVLLGLAAGCLALSAGALSPARAARPVTLTYAGYMAGLPVFSFNTTVTLPAGTVPGNGGYSIAADGQTAGNFRLLYPYAASINASGALKNQKAAPRQFRSVSQIMGRQEAVTLTYGAGGKVGIDAQPLTRQAQEAAAQGFADGTMDPASAIVAMVADFARTHRCQGTYKLFDGVRRYDLILAQGGFVDLNPMQQSYYDGSATECRAEPQLLQGFSAAARQSQFYPQAARLWLAPAVTGLPAIPVRIEAQNALGVMVLDLVDVQF